MPGCICRFSLRDLTPEVPSGADFFLLQPRTFCPVLFTEKYRTKRSFI